MLVGAVPSSSSILVKPISRRRVACTSTGEGIGCAGHHGEREQSPILQFLDRFDPPVPALSRGSTVRPELGSYGAQKSHRRLAVFRTWVLSVGQGVNLGLAGRASSGGPGGCRQKRGSSMRSVRCLASVPHGTCKPRTGPVGLVGRPLASGGTNGRRPGRGFGGQRRFAAARRYCAGAGGMSSSGANHRSVLQVAALLLSSRGRCRARPASPGIGPTGSKNRRSPAAQVRRARAGSASAYPDRGHERPTSASRLVSACAARVVPV